MSSPRQEVYLSYKPKQSTISSVTFRSPNTISFIQETTEHENKLKKWALSIFKGNARIEKNSHSISSITTQLTFTNDEMRARFEKCLSGKDVRGAIRVLDELPKEPAWRQEEAPEYKLKTFLSDFQKSCSAKFLIRDCVEDPTLMQIEEVTRQFGLK